MKKYRGDHLKGLPESIHYIFFSRLNKKKIKKKLKIEISQRSEGVGTPDLESLQGISFPNDFSWKNIFSTRGVIFFRGGGGINFGQLKLLLKIVDFHLKSIISRCDFALKSHQIHRKSSFYLL